MTKPAFTEEECLEVAAVIGGKAQQVIEHLLAKSREGVRLTLTAGEGYNESEVFLCNGDSITVDVRRVCLNFAKKMIEEGYEPEAN